MLQLIAFYPKDGTIILTEKQKLLINSKVASILGYEVKKDNPEKDFSSVIITKISEMQLKIVTKSKSETAWCHDENHCIFNCNAAAAEISDYLISNYGEFSQGRKFLGEFLFLYFNYNGMVYEFAYKSEDYGYLLGQFLIKIHDEYGKIEKGETTPS